VNFLQHRWVSGVSTGLWLSVTAGIVIGIIGTGFNSVAAAEPGEPPASPEQEPPELGFILYALSYTLMPLACIIAVAIRVHWIGYTTMPLQTGYMILGGFGIGGALLIATLPIIVITAIAMASRPPAKRIHT
jgi:hypothetical protein